MRAYLTRVGTALDVLLNCALLNGDTDETISEHAALAQQRRERWGCWLCWWLSLTVERAHCPRVLAGKSEHPAAAVRAGVQLLIVAAALWFAAHLLLHLAASIF